MTNNQLLEGLKVALGDKILGVDEQYDALIIEIAPENIFSVVKTLKEDPQLSFNFLTLIGGVHFPEEAQRELGVVYHLHSWKNAIRIRLKAFLPIDNPRIESLCALFDGANWMERETFDFFGIHFENHPNLTRILNMDEMDYHPMLKQYTLEDGTREDKDDRFFGR